MRLDTEFVRLPLTVDAVQLAAEIAGFTEEDWRPHPQGHAGNSALALVAAGGDPLNDETRGPMGATPHLVRCPYLTQVLAALGAPLGRTRLMRIDGNGEATAHTDTNYYWQHHVRVHVPVVTTPGVSFVCGNRRVHMPAGEVWIFDTWRMHNVLNPDPTRRIHLVADTVGSAAFWNLVASGARPVDALVPAPADDARVPFQPGVLAALRFESTNQPVVMSPFEQRVLLDGLWRDLDGTPEGGTASGLEAFRLDVLRFQRDWHAAWSEFGDQPQGWPAFRGLLEAMAERLAAYDRRFRLPNGTDAAEAVRQMIVRPALNPDLRVADGPSRPAGVVRASVPVPPARQAERPARPRTIDRPVFIVSSPRSGSSLLFETLAKSPTAWTIGGESHAIIEAIPALHPKARDFESNVLDATDAAPDIAAQLTAAFVAQARSREGEPATAARMPIRLLEKTPKNSLRVPFLAEAFPDARFVYLYREPRETLSSMLDAWKSRRFVTYPQLPGWVGPPWSLLLVPGWRQLAGAPLADIVVEQWATATRILLDDLEQLDPDQWCVASYDRLVDGPQEEITRLCRFLDLEWDQVLTAPLPHARHTLTPPDRQKWRKNLPELAPFLHLIEETAARARAVFGEQPPPRPLRRPPVDRPGSSAAPADTPVTVPPAPPEPATPPAKPAAQNGAAGGAEPDTFRSVYTGSLPRVLAQLGASVFVSTYQSGRVIAVRLENGRVNTHFKFFPSPMGMALGPQGLLLGTQRGVWCYENQPAVGGQIAGTRPDACFVPRRFQATGDIRVHEVAWCGDEAWIVNTRFSCLATLDPRYSFVPRWRPRFVTAFAAEDRCHLNGLCVIDGAPTYVTALGTTDTHQGWRERKADGGVIIDVASGEFVAQGLSMPHSPRWHDGRLWVLESGKGEINTIDLKTGRSETVAQVPGFTRGLAFVGPLALVGLSQVRESVFGGIPLAQRVSERNCGVWVVDTRTGQTVAFLRFEGRVQEIFDVLLLPGLVFPDLLEPEDPIVAGSYRVPSGVIEEWKTDATG